MVLRLTGIYPSYEHNAFEKTQHLLDVLESIKPEDSWKASEQPALLYISPLKMMYGIKK